MAKDSTIKNIIREAIREELLPFKTEIKSEILDGVGQLFREFKNDLTTMKDKIVGEIQNFREENTILNLKGQHQRLLDVDKRVDKLEKIHPKFTHAAI